jgi:hypothetical protein
MVPIGNDDHDAKTILYGIARARLLEHQTSLYNTGHKSHGVKDSVIARLRARGVGLDTLSNSPELMNAWRVDRR